jgi:hypothetical protein
VEPLAGSFRSSHDAEHTDGGQKEKMLIVPEPPATSARATPSIEEQTIAIEAARNHGLSEGMLLTI